MVEWLIRNRLRFHGSMRKLILLSLAIAAMPVVLKVACKNSGGEWATQRHLADYGDILQAASVIWHRPQWYEGPGGSREYIRVMLGKLGDRLTLHLNAPVQHVISYDSGVKIQLAGSVQTFDQVIFACHSSQALAVLEDCPRRTRRAGRNWLAA